MSIYLDNCATSPPTDAAREGMLSAYAIYGNPSSLHTAGLEAEKLLNASRKTIGDTLGVKNPKDRVVFCGSGTEANNLALTGVAMSKKFFAGKRIIITDSEHPSVEETARALERHGFDVARIPTRGGVVDTDSLADALHGPVFLVSVMTVNNESGAMYDIRRITALCRERCPAAIIHTDATQAYMKTALDVRAPGVDLLTISGHKIGAPKGIGALYIAENVLKTRSLTPVIHGGGQEYTLRSGTENVIFAASFAAAARARQKTLAADIEKMRSLRDYTVKSVRALGEITVNEAAGACSPSILSLTLPGIKSEVMLHFLSARGIYVSSGSACSSHHPGISRAMTAFGLTAAQADCTVRVSFSPENTYEECDELIKALGKGLETLIRTGK